MGHARRLGAGRRAPTRRPRAGTIFVVNSPTPETDYGTARDDDLTDAFCDVDSGEPGVQCTLYAAVQNANVTPGADTVTF